MVSETSLQDAEDANNKIWTTNFDLIWISTIGRLKYLLSRHHIGNGTVRKIQISIMTLSKDHWRGDSRVIVRNLVNDATMALWYSCLPTTKHGVLSTPSHYERLMQTQF
jgi:hypothetical protein